MSPDVLLDALTDLFNAIPPETPEAIDAELRAAGHDPDTVAARMRAVAAKAMAQQD